MATKRSTKPFSRNPKNKTHVLVSKTSQNKAVTTFHKKAAHQLTRKRMIPKRKVVPAAAPAPVLQPQTPVPVASPAVLDPVVEQANKLAITTQLLKINDALKALKLAEREACAKRIYAAEAKAIAQRAAVYRKANKAGKFPASWTYPKPEVQPPFEFKG